MGIRRAQRWLGFVTDKIVSPKKKWSITYVRHCWSFSPESFLVNFPVLRLLPLVNLVGGVWISIVSISEMYIALSWFVLPVSKTDSIWSVPDGCSRLALRRLPTHHSDALQISEFQLYLLL